MKYLSERSNDPSPKNLTIPSNKPTVSLQCPNHDQARHCRMWKPDGELLEDTCETSATITSDSNWKCATMHWGEMHETRSEVNVIVEKEAEMSKAKIIDGKDGVILTCQEAGDICRAEKPNGDQLFVFEGLLMDRYNSFDTQLA